MTETEKILFILGKTKASKIVRLRIEKVILNVETMTNGGLRIIYSDGFMDLTKQIDHSK